MTHEYIIDGESYPRVTGILAGMGFIDTTWFTEGSRERGTLVHQACEMDDRGTLDDGGVSGVIVPYLHAWRLFKRESGAEMLEVEKTVCSKTHRYAGTLDRIALINGKKAVLDIKTGARSKVTGLQLAAYEEAYGERLARYAVHLTNTGTYSLVPYRDRTDRIVFLAAVTCWHWQNN